MKKITPHDAETKSADIVADNLSQLQSLFPEAFAEGMIQFEVLRQLLGGDIDNSEEKYGLNWHGKRRSRQIALASSTGTLRPHPEESVDWESTQNLVIEGDNLEVLKLLQKSYAGKVKLIYIDPPYNTGKDFVYPDSFQNSIGNYLKLTKQVDGNLKMSTNTEASGRFHTDWLNMIYPRLRLARSLLSKDGFIMISIDDTELHQLRAILDELFGAENFETCIVWEGGRKNDARRVSTGHDYILVYARDASALQELDVRWRDKKSGLSDVYSKADELNGIHGDDYGAASDALQAWFKSLPEGSSAKEHAHYKMMDEKGVWYGDNISSPNLRQNLVFDWKGYTPPTNGWRYDRVAMERLDKEGLLLYPKSKDQRIQYKRYLHNTETWAPSSVFYKDRRAASKSLATVMGADVFDFPKDTDVLSRWINIITKEGDLVLDFFAGSGTTGHAVMNLNVTSNLQRRFVLVQLPEPLDSENKEQKSAASFCKSLNKPLNIAELTKERLRRVANIIKNQSSPNSADLGFRVFKLDSSNLKEWNPERENIVQSLLNNDNHILDGRTEADLVFELLLKLGIDLCVPIESRDIAGKTVGAVGGGVLMMCLATEITAVEVESVAVGIISWHRQLAPVGDSTVVFRDSAFDGDVAKTNMSAILAQNGLDNVRSL